MLHHYREEDLADPRFPTSPNGSRSRSTRSRRGAAAAQQPGGDRHGQDTDGRTLTKRVQFSRGHPRNPMSDDELGAKFLGSVAPVLGEKRAKELIDRIWNIEDLDDVGKLMAMTCKAA